jgi:predicted dehydrogenase
MSSSSIGVAVVGLGYWGPNLARVCHESSDFDLRALCDLDAGLAARHRLRYPGVRVTTSLEDVLDDDRIEAVLVATPVSTHHPIAMAALEANKHVFVEKPLAGSSSDALELVETAEQFDRVLMPGHTFLYSPPVNFSRDVIRRGDLGDVYFISTSRVNLGLHQADVSVVWDLGPHDFSILRYWLGESPIRASGMSRSCVLEDTPDVAFVNLEYASGTIAHVELSWLAPSKLRRTAVVGSRKMLVYDDTSNEPVRVFDSGADLPDPETFGEYKMTYRTGDITSPRISVAEPLSLELADFANSIRTGDEPRSSARLGYDVVVLAEAVEQSLEQRGMPIDIDVSALSR